MAKPIDSIIDKLNATIVAEVPDVGGGAFGAARLAGIVGDFAKRRVSRVGELGELAIPEKPPKLPE